MKKIMFNDRFGLTDDVLAGRKTMTRRLASLPPGITGNDLCKPVMGIDGCGKVYFTFDCADGKRLDVYPYYQVGEKVAVSQCYKQVYRSISRTPVRHEYGLRISAVHHTGDLDSIAGWTNKMFVKASLMPNRIRITDVKLERLQDITDDDCLREGVIPVTWRQWLPQDLEDTSPQKYRDHDVWTLTKFRDSILDSWSEGDPDEYMAETAKVAYAVLIFKLMGKKMWYSNPWVFAYSFELNK